MILGSIDQRALQLSITGLSPSTVCLSRTIHLTIRFLTLRSLCKDFRQRPTTPVSQRLQALHDIGLGCFPFARRYLGNRFYFLFLGLLRCFNSPSSLFTDYVFIGKSSDITRKGLPHSEIPGSKDVCSSPRLIAAGHVLHRLSVPRHPPYALSSLTTIL